jgi:hypothetical protein
MVSDRFDSLSMLLRVFQDLIARDNAALDLIEGD